MMKFRVLSRLSNIVFVKMKTNLPLVITKRKKVNRRRHSCPTSVNFSEWKHVCSPYQVHTCPDFVRARENWAPHSTLQTPCPLSFSTTCGTLQPSLPPRPSFPKSPSPHDQTLPSLVSARVWASRLPQATSIAW